MITPEYIYKTYSLSNFNKNWGKKLQNNNMSQSITVNKNIPKTKVKIERKMEMEMKTEVKIDNISAYVELYEFELLDYPDDINKNTPVQFGELYNTDKDKCGIIKSIKETKEDKYDDIFSSSCDPLTSETNKEKSQSGGIMTNKQLYEKYKLWRAKDDPFKKDGIYTDLEGKQIKQDLYNEAQQATEKMKTYINNKIKEKITGDLETGALIFKINVDVIEKVILFGDFHGSFHTFFRHMLRLHRYGVLDMKTYKIKPGYRIIFLGDIIDRGEYGLEIISFIIKLIIENNTETKLNIIYNRGNHETKDIYATNGFVNELKKKKVSIKDYALFFTFCPSAIVLQAGKKKYWLCHGGIPFIKKDDSEKELKKDDIREKIKKDDIVFIQSLSDDYKSIPEQIRWNDFSYTSDKNILSENNEGRNIGQIIYQTYVHEFLKENEIDFIIRGHQDYPYNSFLLSSDKKKYSEYDYRFVIGYNKSHAIKENKVISFNKNREEKERMVSHGPIARIKLNGREWNDANEDFGILIYNEPGDNTHIYPVLTISTNTDKNRNLTHDSFAVLRFDVSDDKFHNFDKDVNLFDTRNKLEKFEI